jgi:DnaJ-domain-containing protein 1
MSIGSSKLAGMPQDQREKLQSCVKLLLLWVASSDGKLEEEELEYASSQFPDQTGPISTADFLAVIRNSDVSAIEKAIRAVASESRDLRTAFLDMAISMSMADKEIEFAENHILRFYADALHLELGMLEKRFKAITGMEFPDPGDPANPAWWDELIAKEREQQQKAQPSGPDLTVTPGSDNRPASGMSIAQAQTVLGVSLNATRADIERNYQDLAAIFQVDRIEAMGEAAVSHANSRFRKIQQAYQLLRATPE